MYFGVAQTFAARTNRVIHCEDVNLGNLQTISLRRMDTLSIALKGTHCR